MALRVPFTFVTRSGSDASSDVGRSRVVAESSFERMRGRESWGPSLVGSVSFDDLERAVCGVMITPFSRPSFIQPAKTAAAGSGSGAAGGA